MENDKSIVETLPEDCQPKPFVSGEYELAECQSNQWSCSFALHYGQKLLCRHLRRKEIIDQLRKLKDTDNQD
jgi:hypothetical protein